jgi:hypothetical protein
MSGWGRADAAERWHEGDYGPDAPMSRSTKRSCRDCGFFLPLAGSLGAMFGVCGNELSADGHVVDKQYGCGAHSDTPAPPGTGSAMYEPYDDGVLEVTETSTVQPAEATAEAPVEATAEATTDAPAEAPAEASTEAPSDAPVEATAEAPVEAPTESPD